MDQLVLAIITTLFIVAVIFILLGTEKHHKHLKKVISLQDSTIKSLRDENKVYDDKLREKELNITRLAAENAVMKQKIFNLELDKLSEPEKAVKIFNETGMFIFKNEPNKEDEPTQICKQTGLNKNYIKPKKTKK